MTDASIMTLGAEYMQTLRRRDEETACAVAALRETLLSTLHAEISPGIQVVRKEARQRWPYFTQHATSARELALDLHRQIGALRLAEQKPPYVVNNVALKVFPLSNGTVVASLLF